MRHIPVLLLTAIIVAFPGISCGDDPASKIPSDLVVERFSISRNGGPLLVPVTVAQKEYLFVVDTGATLTCFDTSMPLGRPVMTKILEGAQGRAKIKLYQPPEGKSSMDFTRSSEHSRRGDFKSMRQMSGHDFYGILGMDFLSRYVVQIDIEKKENFCS